MRHGNRQLEFIGERLEPDFLPVLDLRFRHAFLFFMTELSSRQVVHFGVTRAPTAAWVAQQHLHRTSMMAQPSGCASISSSGS